MLSQHAPLLGESVASIGPGIEDRDFCDTYRRGAEIDVPAVGNVSDDSILGKHDPENVVY